MDSFRAAHAALTAAGLAFLYPEPQRVHGRAWHREIAYAALVDDLLVVKRELDQR